jgi:hypothetical protein
VRSAGAAAAATLRRLKCVGMKTTPFALVRSPDGEPANSPEQR